MALFLAAIRSVFENLGVALRVALLPMAVLMTVNLWAADPGFDGGVLPEVFATIVDFTVVCWIAVGWHRFALISEAPGQFTPQWNGGAIFGYFVTWIVLGIVLMLPVLGMTLLVYAVSFPWLDGTGLIEALGGSSFSGGPNNQSFDLFFGWVGAWAFLYLLFRTGIMLPAKAAYGYGIGLRKTFELTRGLRGELGQASFVASIFVAIFFIGPLFLIDTSAEQSEKNLILTSLATDLGYVLNVVFGAAILNMVFKRAVMENEMPNSP